MGARVLCLIAIWLTAATVAVQPSLGGDDTSRCDEKAIQKAKEDYDKAMKAYAAAAAESDRTEAIMEEDYKEAEKAFDETMGVGASGAFTDLTMHATAMLGSEAAERLIPPLAILDLVEFTGSCLRTIQKDLQILDKTQGLALQAARLDADADVALNVALVAKQQRERLEAECKRKKSAFEGTNVAPSVMRGNETAPWRLLAGTKNLLIVGDASTQDAEGADLAQLKALTGALYQQHYCIFHLCFGAHSAFVNASASIAQARSMLPLTTDRTAKLEGPALARFEKVMAIPFQQIAQGVQNFDQVGPELTKIGQIKGEQGSR